MARPKTIPIRRKLGPTKGWRRLKKPWWIRISQEKLLEVRLCDLKIDIVGTALQSRIQRLYGELGRAGLRFRPHIWLSSDWFTPDGVTGFAVPFYLAHPRLTQIEHRQMFEVEGGTHDWCMKLLRHETGHALDNAFRLHWKKKWREAFGRFSETYRTTYMPETTSKNYVHNLDFWYSQSHPAEDFAESFAVWLQPGSRWRARYAGWPVLEKLEYVDELMSSLRDKPQVVRCRRQPESLSRLRMTLREYYEQKKTFYEEEEPTTLDHHLRRIFSDAPGYAYRDRAVRFLRRQRRELRGRVSALTGQHRYVVDQALNLVIARCKELNLRMTKPDRETLVEVAILLTIMTIRFLHGGRQQYRR